MKSRLAQLMLRCGVGAVSHVAESLFHSGCVDSARPHAKAQILDHKTLGPFEPASYCSWFREVVTAQLSEAVAKRIQRCYFVLIVLAPQAGVGAGQGEKGVRVSVAGECDSIICTVG